MDRKSVAILQVLFSALLVIAFTITGYATAEAQEVSRPQYIVGEKWVFDINGELSETVVVGYGGNSYSMRLTFRDKSLIRYFSLDGNPIKDADEDGNILWDYRGEYALYRFPLYVGKKWDEIYYTRNSGARRMQVRVTAYEEVTVPAGTFWAYKLEAANQRLDRPLAAYETYWYAPAVKKMVKYSSWEFGMEIKLLQYIPAPAPTAK